MKKDPTPGQLAHALHDLITEAVRLSEAYSESIDYAFRPHSPGSLALTSGSGWRSGETPDPTAQTAMAYDRKRVRWAARKVPKAVERARRELDAAGMALTSAWLDIDPDLARDRHDRRQAAMQSDTRRTVAGRAVIRARGDVRVRD